MNYERLCMKIYSHRINSVSALAEIDPKYGVEIDLRTNNGNLILAHDPFIEGDLFSDWLRFWRGQSLILNVKEDALENSILQYLNEYGVSDFFFLDQSYPSIRRTINSGLKKVATRVSDYEDLQTALNSGSDWVWLDSFSGKWDYLNEAVPVLAKNGQKTCLVSPELQRTDSSAELKFLQKLILDKGLDITSVCTKLPEIWES
jgi:hypothetical protein